MSLLSITFHVPENLLNLWEDYAKENLELMIENLMDVNQYVFSDVESGLINEGKNYNLLLIFDGPEIRQQFIESELVNISDRLEKEFSNEVSIFISFLNPIKKRI